MTGLSTDIQDVMLDAQAAVMEVVQEIMMEVQRDELIRQMRQVWMTMPDPMKEQFKIERPQEYSLLMKEVQDARQQQ